MLHSLSKYCAFLRLAGQKHWLFPTCPLCFSLQLNENRDTLWLLTQCTQTTSDPARMRIYTHLFWHVCAMMGWCSVSVWSEPKLLKSEESLQWSLWTVSQVPHGLQTAALQVLKGSTDWSFNLHCILFLSPWKHSTVNTDTPSCLLQESLHRLFCLE